MVVSPFFSSLISMKILWHSTSMFEDKIDLNGTVASNARAHKDLARSSRLKTGSVDTGRHKVFLAFCMNRK